MTLGEKLTKALSQNRVHLLTTFGNGLLQVPSPKVFGDPCTLISATKLNQLPSSKLFGNHLLQLPSPLPSQRRLSILTTPNYVHSHSLEFGILSQRRFPSTLTTANFRRGDSLYSHNGEFQERRRISGEECDRKYPTPNSRFQSRRITLRGAEFKHCGVELHSEANALCSTGKRRLPRGGKLCEEGSAGHTKHS